MAMWQVFTRILLTAPVGTISVPIPSFIGNIFVANAAVFPVIGFECVPYCYEICWNSMVLSVETVNDHLSYRSVCLPAHSTN